MSHDTREKKLPQPRSTTAAEIGTNHAIGLSLFFGNSETEKKSPIAPDVPNFRERRAERIFSAILTRTPRGAPKPWRTARSLALISSLLDQGVPEGDLLDHVAGAAELIARGREPARWWAVGNLFGPNNIEIWRANIAEMRAGDRRRAAEDARLVADREEHHAASVSGPPERVTSLQLHKVVTAAAAAMREASEETKETDAREG